MDDIICPECGRPNLGEAKKCWYCQTELEGNALDQEEEFAPDNQSSNITQPEDEIVQSEIEEEIPEWLARIRHKIEEERDPEEELPYWKQKDIFGGEKKIEKKSSKEKYTHKSKKSTKKTTDKTKNIDIQNPITKNDNEIELEDLSNDLPEGFTEL